MAAWLEACIVDLPCASQALAIPIESVESNAPFGSRLTVVDADVLSEEVAQLITFVAGSLFGVQLPL